MIFSSKNFRFFSYLCLIRSTSDTNIPILNTLNSIESLNSKRPHVNVDIPEPNFTDEQRSKAPKRKFTDFSIENLLKSPNLSHKSFSDDQSVIECHNSCKNESNSGRNNSKNLGKNNESSLKTSPNEASCSARSEGISPFINTEDNQKSVSLEDIDVPLKGPAILPNLQIYSELSEFIAKLVYFRDDFYRFLEGYCSNVNQNLRADLSFSYYFKQVLKCDSSLIYHQNSEIIVKNLMLLIHMTLDLAKKLNLSQLNFKKYHNISSKIIKHRKSLNKLMLEMKNEDISAKEHLELKNATKNEIATIADLELQRENLPKNASFKYVTRYAKYISNLGTKFGFFGYRWIAIICSLNKIMNFYDQNLKEIVDNHLDKFRCPAFYKNREILLKQNSFLDINSFSAVILDWVFYFFSLDFKVHLASENDGNIKLLSRMTSLLFVLFSKPETVKLMLNKEEIYDRWIEDLEKSFRTGKYCASPNAIFNTFYNKIEKFDGLVERSMQNFYFKIVRNSKLDFLDKIENILEDHLIPLYEIGIEAYKSIISDENK